MQSNQKPEFDDFKMDGEASKNLIDAGSVAVHQSSKLDNYTTTTQSKSDLEAAIMPPPAQVGSFTAPEPRPPSSIASEKDEDEVLSLQVLSARSSTPYTVQAVCCNNVNCELGATDSTTVSPVKEEATGLLSDKNKRSMVNEEVIEQRLAEDKKYTRSDLINIRDEMMVIVRPECFGSSRLRRLNLGKLEGGSVGNRGKNFRSTTNPPNDLMPAFFKRKTASLNGNGNGNASSNHITYDAFKYTDSHPYNNYSDGGPQTNHRRIGSGRLSNRDVNWDYIPEEDPDKDNLPEFFNTKSTTSNTKNQRHSKKFEAEDNSNYVKRVINSVVGESSHRSRNSNNSSTEERYSTNSSSTSNANNKSEEPEWFSCGPTSRLDTIELCGFNESDQQQIRIEMESSKKKPDANNNHEETISNGVGHKEKKHLAFQFDDFSTHSGKTNSSVSNAGNASSAANRIASSKFMPLFNAKKRDEETPHSQNSSQSVNDFFKRSEMPTLQKDKLSLAEIPSVNEIEAKWRTQQQQQNESKSKTTADNMRNSSENFKKMLNQLNQQQNSGLSVSPPPPQPMTNQPALNLFNNENLSNFIKQRNLQQQLLRKQQQQAAFAQLQLNAILGRPDTQMLLLSLARGEISKHGLLVQLANPNLTPTDRDAISAVLTFSTTNQYHNPLTINSSHQQQQQLFANQLQNLALLQQMNKTSTTKRNVGNGVSFQANGGGGGGSNVRTFSQEELQSHANYILQNAMMKKKLEEQTNLGVQKLLQLQNSMLNNNNNGNNTRGNETLAASKHQQQQQQLHYQQSQSHQNRQRQRKGFSAGGNRDNNPMRRRRSTSSSSSNATVNTSQMKLASDLEYCQIEQRRNTIATTTIAAAIFAFSAMRIHVPRGITKTQFFVGTAVGFLSGIYIWQPLIVRHKRENSAALQTELVPATTAPITVAK